MAAPKLCKNYFSIDSLTSCLFFHDSLSTREIAINYMVLQTNKEENQKKKNGTQKQFTMVSNPRVRSIKKNIMAQKGERGSLVKASGYTTKAIPGPRNKKNKGYEIQSFLFAERLRHYRV